MNDPGDLMPRDGDDEDTLWRKVHGFCADRLGVTSILYGFTHAPRLPEWEGLVRCVLLRHSHPREYVDHFGGDRFLENDLCTLSVINGSLPFLWHHAHDFPEATAEQIEQARIDREFGMDVGVSLGFEFAGGRGLSGIGLCAKGSSAEDFEARWIARREEVEHYLGSFEPLMRKRMIENRLKLTPRQRAILSYSAGGLLVKEIAERLGIREGTVYNYLEAARRALGATTTLEAVAKAYVFELV